MPHLVRFGFYEADLDSGQLSKRGIPIKLRHQSFEVLASLLERAGQVVTRDDLRQRLWKDEIFVDFENGLNTAVAHLREALCDSAKKPAYIETLPKRGYRFVADIGSAPAHREMQRGRARVLILPFAILGGGPGQEYLGDVMTEEIITALASLTTGKLAVIARTTAMRYKGNHKDVSRIGRELSVDYVVEGSVRPLGDKLRVNVQLISADDQAHVFARVFEAQLQDPYETEMEIASTVAAHMPINGCADRTAAPARNPKKPVANIAALNEYIQGRNLLQHATSAAMQIARTHLERSIELEPELPQAYDALAELHWYCGYLGLTSPREAFATGILHALRALELDNGRAETHALIGQFHKISEYNWEAVEREMSLAQRLDPGSPTVKLRNAISGLMPHGKLAEAKAELECALETDPLSLVARSWLGIMLVLSREYDRALEEARKVRDLDPEYYLADFVTALALRYQGRAEESIAAQRRAVELSGGAAGMIGWLGLGLAASGRADEARGLLRRLQTMRESRYVPATSLAWIHMGLREVDAALWWLEQAVEDCDQYLMPIKSYRFLDPIRSDPRFTALLRKMHLS